MFLVNKYTRISVIAKIHSRSRMKHAFNTSIYHYLTKSWSFSLVEESKPMHTLRDMTFNSRKGDESAYGSTRCISHFHTYTQTHRQECSQAHNECYKTTDCSSTNGQLRYIIRFARGKFSDLVRRQQSLPVCIDPRILINATIDSCIRFLWHGTSNNFHSCIYFGLAD